MTPKPSPIRPNIFVFVCMCVFSSPYSEYTLASATPGINFSEDTNSEYVFFDFYFQRGTNFYLLNIILPVTIFSTLSILTMILGLNSFQRIALNLTLLLVAVAQKISISKLMPVSDKRIWIVDFVGNSFIWIAVTLFETVMVTTIASIREERKKEKEAKMVCTSFFFIFASPSNDVCRCIFIIIKPKSMRCCSRAHEREYDMREREKERERKKK